MPEIYDDIDAYIDGAQRSEAVAEIFLRPDLDADIQILEAEQRLLKSIPDEDRAMGDSNGSELQAQIDALYVQMGNSKRDFRVRALNDEETELIRTTAAKDIKELLDKAASDARADAKVQCERAGIKGVNDINAFVRAAAIAASSAVLQKELDFRVIADALVSPRTDVERLKKLVAQIGEVQFNKVKEAYSRATNTGPKVMVPKSLTPSPIDDGPTSS